MAVARIFEGKGWTSDQYDALMRELDLPDGRAAPGVLFHWAERTEEGMRAIDVYESRDAADRLVAERVGPAAQKLGLPLPDVTEHEVHAYLS